MNDDSYDILHKETPFLVLKNPEIYKTFVSDVKEYIAKIFGLPKDVEYNNLLGRINKVKHMVKERCMYIERDYKTVMDCVYNYKANKVSDFKKIPFLAMTRGTVVRYYIKYEGGKRKIEYNEIMAMPFPKFFNRGEFQYLGEPDIDMDTVTAITEKLDGTLIIVSYDKDFGVLRMNTRGMLYRNNPYVEAFKKWMNDNNYYYEILGLTENGRYTVLFELTGKTPASMEAYNIDEILSNKKPVLGGNYKAYLLARRHMGTLEIQPSTEINTNLPKPKQYSIDDIDKFENEINKWRDVEGVVVYTNTYYRNKEFLWWNKLVKLKSWNYLMALQMYGKGELNKKSLAKYVILGYADDVIALAKKDEDKQLAQEIQNIYSIVETLFTQIYQKYRENPDKIEKILKNNLHAGWLIKYLKLAKKREPEKIAKKLVIENMSRDPVKQLKRLKNRLEIISLGVITNV